MGKPIFLVESINFDINFSIMAVKMEADLKNTNQIRSKIKKIKTKFVQPQKSNSIQKLNNISLIHFSVSPKTIFFNIQSKINLPLLKSQKLSVGTQMRAQMIDWMIEVHSKCSLRERTFFLCIEYLDCYLQKCSKLLSIDEFHLIGIVIMFCAAKYEQIYPFCLREVIKKIGHSKFRKQQIIQAEALFLQTVSYRLTYFTLCDHTYYFLNSCILEGKRIKQHIIPIMNYFLKALIHFERSQQIQPVSTSIAIVYLTLKSIEKKQKNIKSDQYLKQLSQSVQISKSLIQERSQNILKKVNSFQEEFQNLENLQRFNGTLNFKS